MKIVMEKNKKNILLLITVFALIALIVPIVIAAKPPTDPKKYCFVTDLKDNTQDEQCNIAFGSGEKGFSVLAGKEKGSRITKVRAANCIDLLDKLEEKNCNVNWCKWTSSTCACMDIECTGTNQTPPYCFDDLCEVQQGGIGCCRIQSSSPCPEETWKTQYCNFCGESDGTYGYCCDQCQTPCVGNDCGIVTVSKYLYWRGYNTTDSTQYLRMCTLDNNGQCQNTTYDTVDPGGVFFYGHNPLTYFLSNTNYLNWQGYNTTDSTQYLRMCTLNEASGQCRSGTYDTVDSSGVYFNGDSSFAHLISNTNYLYWFGHAGIPVPPSMRICTLDSNGQCQSGTYKVLDSGGIPFSGVEMWSG